MSTNWDAVASSGSSEAAAPVAAARTNWDAVASGGKTNWDSVASSSPATKENPVKGAIGKAERVLGNFGRNALHYANDRKDAAKYYGSHAIEGYEAYEGIGRRAIEGGEYALMHGRNPVDYARKLAAHPGEEQTILDAQHGFPNNKISNKPVVRQLQQASNMFDDFTTQLTSDPINLITGDAGAIGNAIGKIPRVAPKVANVLGHVVEGAVNPFAAGLRGAGAIGQQIGRVPLSGGTLAQHVANQFQANPQLRTIATKFGLNAATGATAAANNLRRETQASNDAIIAPHEDAHRQMSFDPIESRRGNLDPSVSRLLDSQAWDKGTLQVRRAILRDNKSGFVPTPEQYRSQPRDILRSYDPNYVPTKGVSQKVDASPSPNLTRTVRKSKPTGNNEKHNPAITGDDFHEQLLQNNREHAQDISRYDEQRGALEATGLGPNAQIGFLQERLAKAHEDGNVKLQSSLQKAISDVFSKNREQFQTMQKALQPGVVNDRQASLAVGSHGGIFKTRDQSLLDAKAQERMLGNNVDAAFGKNGKLLPVPHLTPAQQRGTLELSRYAAISRIDKAAKRSADLTEKRAAQSALGQQKRGQIALNALQKRLDKSSAQDVTRAEKVAENVQRLAAIKSGGKVKTDQGNGDIFNLPNLQAITKNNYVGTDASKAAMQPVEKEVMRLAAKSDKGSDDVFGPVAQALTGKVYDKVLTPSRKAASVSEAAMVASRKRMTTAKNNIAALRAQKAAVERVAPRAEQIYKDANTVQLPTYLHDRLFGEQQKINKGPLAGISDFGRDALLVMGLPHMKNIFEQAVLGNDNPASAARGIHYARQLKAGNADALKRSQELAQTGGTQHFERNVDPTYANIPVLGPKLAAFAKKQNEMLDRFETGQRMAALDDAEKKGLSGFQAGGHVNDIFGNHGEQSKFVEWMRNGVGAEFPAWSYGIVPQTMSRALREHPRRITAAANALTDLNQDILEPDTGSDLNPGGPLPSFLQMTQPAGFVPYVRSPSRTGPVGAVFAANDALFGPSKYQKGSVEKFGKDVLKVAGGLVPEADLLGDATRGAFSIAGEPTAQGKLGAAASSGASGALDLLGAWLEKVSAEDRARRKRYAIF